MKKKDHGLIIQPTEVASWYGLVCESQSIQSINLSEEIESYLVFLLMRFSTQVQFASSALGLDTLKAIQSIGQSQYNQLRDVGDKCLLTSGLFPERAEKRLLTNKYYIELGRVAYGLLANSHMKSISTLFTSLTKEYNSLVETLYVMRYLPTPGSLELPTNIVEKLLKTHDLQTIANLKRLYPELEKYFFDNDKKIK